MLNSLNSADAKRGYRHAIDEFVDWYCSEPRLAFNRIVVLRYRSHLESRHLRFGNDGVNLAATVLYADLSGSTRLVDTKKATFAAEVYKTYLACAARIVKNEGGAVTAYDGDRVMAVFINKDNKNTTSHLINSQTASWLRREAFSLIRTLSKLDAKTELSTRGGEPEGFPWMSPQN